MKSRGAFVAKDSLEHKQRSGSVRFPKRQKYMGLAGALAMGTSLISAIHPVGFALTAENVVQHVTGNTSPEEEMIQESLRKSLGLHAWVNCTDSYTHQTAISFQKPVKAQAVGAKGLGIMTLPETMCHEITSFAKNPDSYKPPRISAAELGATGLEAQELEAELDEAYDEAYKDESSRVESVWKSFQAFAHEAAHTDGEYNEHNAECFSFQAMPSLMKGLGISDHYARAVAESAVTHYKPHDRGPDYTPAENCTPDGLNYGFDEAYYPRTR